MGHLVRTRTLARELRRRGERCAIVGPEDHWRTAEDETLFDLWRAAPLTDTVEDARAFVEDARRLGADVAVMDDYRIDEPYQRRLIEAGLPWMMQYDASAKPWFLGDIIVNASAYETAEGLAPYLKNPVARLLLGPDYSVMRPGFPPAQPQPDARPVRRVLVTFGGGDDRGLVRMILEALVPLWPGIRFEAMCGLGNPRAEDNRRWAEDHGQGRAKVHINPPDVAGLMTSCDVAISSSGTLTFETASCGLPSLLTAIEGNQIDQARGWERRGVSRYLGWVDDATPEGFITAFAALVADDAGRADMARRGRETVDGKGRDRLVEAILSLKGAPARSQAGAEA